MTDRGLTRRALLGIALPLLATAALPRRAAAALAALRSREALRVGVLVSSSDSDARRVGDGLALGADESVRTAALFGVDVDVATRPADANDDAGRAAYELVERGASILVVALPADRCAPIDAIAAQRRALLLNLECPPRAPADGDCGVTSIHLSPSAATVRRALASYARRAAGGEASNARLALWHHTLGRFGAPQLNERFRRRFGREMTASAWAGWMAMKIATEAALRARSADVRGIAAYLASREARFDGHKGEPLGLDPRTGELRQPLYVLTGASGGGERVAAELSIAECYEPIADASLGGRRCPSSPDAR